MKRFVREFAAVAKYSEKVIKEHPSLKKTNDEIDKLVRMCEMGLLTEYDAVSGMVDVVDVMSYIIKHKEKGYAIARDYVGDYRARDYITPLHGEYDGRITAVGAIIFDTIEKAQTYLDGNKWINSDEWQTIKYDACLNTIII